MVIFRNYQWGAEKRNTTLWFDDNFVGTELNLGVEYAKVAEGCGLKGVQVRGMDALTEALRAAVKAQMENNETTFIEVRAEPGTGRALPPRCHEEADGGRRHRPRGYAAAAGGIAAAGRRRRSPLAARVSGRRSRNPVLRCLLGRSGRKLLP